MSKIMKQPVLRKKEPVTTGKSAGQQVHGVSSAPVSSRIKHSSSKVQPAKYMIVQIDHELGKRAEQKEPIAKVEASRVMFAKYYASK